MNTRGHKNAKLSEDELEALRQTMAKQDERMRTEAAALQKQRDEFEQQRAEFNREREVGNKHPERADADQSELLLSFKDEILRELSCLRRDVDKIKIQESPLVTPDGQRPYEQTFMHGESLLESPQSPKVSFREATESVPYFDGYNIPLAQFVRACRRAKEIVPSSSERNLTKILINKLRNRAYYAVEDEPCETITQLIDLLNGAFGSPKTIDQYRGELSTIYIKKNEHMLDYISRAKDLRSAILDAERRSRGVLDPRVAAEVDALTARSFCDGLPLQYRLQIPPGCHTHPFDAFATAKTLAKREELDKQRYDYRNRREDPPVRYAAANPIRRPLAHSTPERNRTPSGFQAAAQHGNYSPTNDTRRANYSREIGTRSPDNYRNYEDRNTRDNGPANFRTGNRPKWCRYCKNVGHEIEECRKREFNNSHPRQGNAGNPSRTPDEPRAGRSQDQSRPINAIEIQPINEESDESLS